MSGDKSGDLAFARNESMPNEGRRRNGIEETEVTRYDRMSVESGRQESGAVDVGISGAGEEGDWVVVEVSEMWRVVEETWRRL